MLVTPDCLSRVTLFGNRDHDNIPATAWVVSDSCHPGLQQTATTEMTLFYIGPGLTVLAIFIVAVMDMVQRVSK